MSQPRGRYPRADFPLFKASTVLNSGRLPRCVDVPAEHVGACILVHGVNDVGTGYQAVEEGLLDGLARRLGWTTRDGTGCPPYTPAHYRMPTDDDARKLEADPDAVFFKRTIAPTTHSPVIPFYWGYRDSKSDRNRNINGQLVDDFDNRLDLDRSKGGGPFANATTNLADMWNRGAPSRINKLLELGSRDPYRPLHGGPGRMYFVLAAQRLAALIAMIRDYNQDVPETVTLIAHSQGCLISLLAQAFLMEDGKPPADTLILTHPPYSLEPHLPERLNRETNTPPPIPTGEDKAMQGLYDALEDLQTVRARLDTLINIVRGVAAQRKPTWNADELARMKRSGLHTAAWKVEKDRDNRGKVYLYFCPEDMTVALPSVQGIGWQGVPHDLEDGRRRILRQPLKELGPTFLQRVFTAKRRVVRGTPQAFKVGLPPQDFLLRIKGEDDHAHADGDVTSFRARLPEHDPRLDKSNAPDDILAARTARRLINGEALETPHTAELHAGAPSAGQGRHERVDPIDAAIAVTSNYGVTTQPPQIINDPRPGTRAAAGANSRPSPTPLTPRDLTDVQNRLNEGRPGGDQVRLVKGLSLGDGRLLITRFETPNEARLRHQQATSPRSFHGAIWGSKANHAHVTAYDVAIGRGQAVTDPGFYRYLCAVADWRLKKPKKGDPIRSGILTWNSFVTAHKRYFEAEEPSRKAIIEGSSDYYSSGILPTWIKSITERPKAVIAETALGQSPLIKPRQEAK
mgnify:CR=1 FL=1